MALYFAILGCKTCSSAVHVRTFSMLE